MSPVSEPTSVILVSGLEKAAIHAAAKRLGVVADAVRSWLAQGLLEWVESGVIGNEGLMKIDGWLTRMCTEMGGPNRGLCYETLVEKMRTPELLDDLLFRQRWEAG